MKFHIRILLIEGDKEICQTICNILTQKNYDVCCATNGTSGIQKAYEYNPDIILCDTAIEPIDGYHVYAILKESSLLEKVSFMYITDLPDFKARGYGINLEADDYFLKSADPKCLPQAIAHRIGRFKKIKEVGRREFSALFNLSPNGIFLFDGHFLVDANPVMISFLNLNKHKISSYILSDFLNADSLKKVKEKINECTQGVIHTFVEQVTFITTSGEKINCPLYMAVYEKYAGYSLWVGISTFDYQKNEAHGVTLPLILNILKKEKVTVTESLMEKLAEVYQQQKIESNHANGFLSKREHQVLRLSMEGLATKIIAEKLSISDRTVEKHRASLIEKTNSKNMLETIVYALKNNLVGI